MKTLIMTLAVITMGAFATLAPSANAMDKHMDDKKAMMAEKAPVTAVMFFSENCGSCKIIDPRLEEASAAFNNEKLAIVKLDFTNDATKAATKELAAAKNLTATLEEYGPKTGFALLVNAQGEVVDQIKVDHDTSDIAAKIAKAIVQAS